MENIIKGVIALGVVGLAALGVKVWSDDKATKAFVQGRVQGQAEMWEVLNGKSDDEIEAELKARGYAVR